jgi:hypothetical protein
MIDAVHSRSVRTPNSFPPQPRLVGIELNPGPKIIKNAVQSAISSAASAIGSAVAKAQKNKAAIAKRPKKRRAQSARGLGLDIPASGSSVLAPTSYGRAYRHRTPSQVVTMQFDSSNLLITTDSNGKPLLNVVGQTPYLSAADINPLDNGAAYGSQPDVLGAPITRIASAFARYKITDLMVTYQPAVSTATDGELVVAYVPDPFTNTVISYSNLSAITDHFNGSPWLAGPKMMFHSRTLNRDLLYTKVNPVSIPAPVGAQVYDAASQRFSSAGSLLVSGFGLPNNKTVGSLRLTGTIHFVGFEVQPVNQSMYISPEMSRGSQVSVMFGEDASCTAAVPFGSGVSRVVSGDFSNWNVSTATDTITIRRSDYAATGIKENYSFFFLWYNKSQLDTFTGVPNTSSFVGTASDSFGSTLFQADYNTFAASMFSTIQMNADGDGVVIAGPAGMTRGTLNLIITRLT